MELLTKNYFWKYYRDVTLYNLILSVAVSIFHSILWGFIVFSSYGVVVGLIGFKFLKNNEYYIYYNLGATKRKLVTIVFLVNLLISGPVFALELLNR